jgi:LPXTG-motif cell wall-anchored protein
MSRLIVRLLCGMLLALAMCGGAFASDATRPAQAATTWQVDVGGASQDGAVEAQAFLPTSITINAGDKITWMFRSFHTVTFLSGAPPPAIILPPSGGNPPSVNSAVAFPAGGPNYDGTGFVNSGFPSEQAPTFSLTFTKAGTYAYVCLIHPGMDGTVVVQAAGSAYPKTQAQVDAQGNAEFFSKLQFGTKLIADAKLTSKPGPNGTTTFTVLDGGGGNQVSLLRFVPVEVTVKAGDSITWVMNDPHEIHTVTFYDASGKPPEFLETKPQQNGPPLLLLPYAGPEGGTSVADPKGFYNSGIQANGQSYTFSFPNPGTYNYICLVHGPIMTGKITVEAAAAPKPSTLPKTGDGAPAAPLLPITAVALLLLLLGAILVRRRA